MDHILYWNAVALEANRHDFTDIPSGATKPMPEQGGPTLSSRALAIVHLAIYDAHAAVVGGPNLPRYLAAPLAPTGIAASDAAAGAAYATLSALFPRQQSRFDLATGGLAPGSNPGFDFGIAVGNAMLADRAVDPGASDAGYHPSTGRFHHRPDPVTAQSGFHAPFYGMNSKCFAVSARHDLDDPRGNPAQYVRAVKQVRGLGIAPELTGTLPAASPKRTPEQTLIGLFWAYDGPRELGTPPRLYNLIVRQVAEERANTPDQNARLFALVNAAMGDAGILAWQEKYKWDLWRPVVGIREGDPSMGPSPAPASGFDADCDPDWRPFGAPASNASGSDFTPPFPAYPSGHATFGAAAFHITRLFYGVPLGDRKKDTITARPVVSEELNGVTRDSKGAVRPRHTRTFKGGLWQMIEENGFSRVYLGVHWFLDAFALKSNKDEPDYTKTRIGGVNLGLAIAEDIWVAGNQKAPKKSTV